MFKLFEKNLIATTLFLFVIVFVILHNQYLRQKEQMNKINLIDQEESQ